MTTSPCLPTTLGCRYELPSPYISYLKDACSSKRQFPGMNHLLHQSNLPLTLFQNSACNNSAIAVEEEVGKKPRKGPEKASNSGSHTGPKRGSTEIEGADDNQPFQAPKKAGQKTTKTNRPTRTNPTVEGRLFSPSVGLCER